MHVLFNMRYITTCPFMISRLNLFRSEESDALLEESEFVCSKVGGSLVSRCMDNVPGLVDKTLLLLEEGEPLVVGIKYINVFLWKQSICRDGPVSLNGAITNGVGIDNNKKTVEKKEKKYSYKGIVLSNMSKEQMLAHIKPLLSRGQRVPAAITDKRKDHKEAQASFATFLKKSGNTDLIDENETDDAVESTLVNDDDNDLQVNTKTASDEEVTVGNAGIDISSCELETYTGSHGNYKYLFNAGRVSITPESTLAELYMAVDSLLQCAADNGSKVKDHVRDDSDWSYDDAVKDVMLPVPSGSLKALVDAGWKYHCNETDQTLEGEEEGTLWSNLLIRDLRSDMLPGKCHRLDPISPSSIHGKSRKDVSPKLKNLNIRGDKAIVLELFPSAAVQNEFRFWLCKIENPNDCLSSFKRVGNTVMTPSSPQDTPFEIIVHGGVAPSLGHLKNAIRTRIPEPSHGANSLRIFKLNESKHVWTEVKQGGGVTTRGKITSIFQSPFNLKEGDFLSAFDEKTKVGDVSKEYSIDRKHDQEKRQVAADSKAHANKGGNNDSIGINGKKNKKNRVEVALSIGDGFDYSSDIDSNESGGEGEGKSEEVKDGS